MVTYMLCVKKEKNVNAFLSFNCRETVVETMKISPSEIKSLPSHYLLGSLHGDK